MADKYVLRVTAGPGYDLADYVEVPVNQSEPVRITSDAADIDLNIRVQEYQGLPRDSPRTSPYFDQEPHKYNQDQYSISFRFTPKKPRKGNEEAKKSDEGDENSNDQYGISGLDLQFGNDFDRPIRDKLPPGFGTAMGIVKWWIDPGLDGDAYADRPYLYGPALSSFNAIHIGASPLIDEKGGIWVEEGGDAKFRQEMDMPDGNKARMKWALSDDVKDYWVWEYGRTYSLDFYNPYVDFANFALRLPGFHIPILKYWDGQALRADARRSHTLRYVLRNRKTGECYLAICFTIHLKEDVAEDGTILEGDQSVVPPGHKRLADTKKPGNDQSANTSQESSKTSSDDLD
jgi:hypothetical protein